MILLRSIPSACMARFRKLWHYGDVPCLDKYNIKWQTGCSNISHRCKSHQNAELGCSLQQNRVMITSNPHGHQPAPLPHCNHLTLTIPCNRDCKSGGPKSDGVVRREGMFMRLRRCHRPVRHRMGLGLQGPLSALRATCPCPVQISPSARIRRPQPLPSGASMGARRARAHGHNTSAKVKPPHQSEQQATPEAERPTKPPPPSIQNKNNRRLTGGTSYSGLHPFR